MPSPPRTAICADCQTEKTAVFRRSLCPLCYERDMARRRGVLPRAEWEAQYAARRRSVDPFTKVFGNTTPGPDGCVIFTGRERSAGYGAISLGGYRDASAHRVAYELLVGPIPAGMSIDHVCHNRSTTCPGGTGCLHRRCVNPTHLEAVPASENTKRAARRPNAKWGRSKSPRRDGECRNGHPHTPENTVWEKRSATSDERRPRCRQCLKDYQANFRERRRQTA